MRYLMLSAMLSAALPAFGLFTTTTGCWGIGDGQPASAFELSDRPTWANGIGQMLTAYCADCHGERPADGSLSYFRVDTYADQGGRLGAYSLRLRHLARVADPARPMPPPPGRAMTPAEIDALRRWVDLGAPLDEAGLSAAPGVLACRAGEVGACACPGGWYGHQICLEDGNYEPCRCGGLEPLPPGPPPADVVLDDVVAWVLRPSCSSGAGCHGRGGAPPDLSADAGLEGRLLGTSLQAPGFRLIEPGYPDQSYLYLKTRPDFVQQGMGTGRQMPPPEAGALTADQAGVLERWIAAGSPE